MHMLLSVVRSLHSLAATNKYPELVKAEKPVNSMTAHYVLHMCYT